MTTVQVDLINGWTFKWARLENEKCIMTIGSGRPMEYVARVAYRELVRWMVQDYGYTDLDASMLLTKVGRVHLNFTGMATSASGGLCADSMPCSWRRSCGGCGGREQQRQSGHDWGPDRAYRTSDQMVRMAGRV